MNDDDDLRTALHDAAEQVHPQPDFATIRARAHQEAPVDRRWYGPAIAAAAAVVLAIGGVGWFAQHQQQHPPATADDATRDSNDPAAPQASTSNDPGHTATVTTYAVGATAAGPRLFPERRVLEGVHTTDLDAAVSAVVEQGPVDPDHRGWPVEGTKVLASADDSTITIDLSDEVARPDTMSEAEARMVVQSLVWTADAAVDDDVPVRFTVDGRPTGSVLGVPTGAPLSKESADSTLSPVQISSPAQGATVPSQFTVEGQASAFEANVVWELKQGDQVVSHGFATAAECCTLSPYSFEVSAAPGSYTLVVHDTDASDGEGHGTTQDTKDITVR